MIVSEYNEQVHLYKLELFESPSCSQLACLPFHPQLGTRKAAAAFSTHYRPPGRLTIRLSFCSTKSLLAVLQDM